MERMSRLHSILVGLYLVCLVQQTDPSKADAQDFQQLITDGRSTDELVSYLENLVIRGQLQSLGSDQLSFSTWNYSGWRREFVTREGQRVIVASDGPLLVAIRESRTIEFSVRDLTDGQAIPRGFAGASRYFGHKSAGVQHVTAMSADHFSRKNPELFQIYFYFAGPTQAITPTQTLPPPAMQLRR